VIKLVKGTGAGSNGADGRLTTLGAGLEDGPDLCPCDLAGGPPPPPRRRRRLGGPFFRAVPSSDNSFAS
jgi:hypothetical protein